MNKREVAEIKRNFEDGNGFFTLERILTGFVDAEKNLLYHKTHSAITMASEDLFVYMETLINFAQYANNHDLEEILAKSAAQKEYKIREKTAEIIKQNNIMPNLINKLTNDDNYYVRAVFKS